MVGSEGNNGVVGSCSCDGEGNGSDIGFCGGEDDDRMKQNTE